LKLLPRYYIDQGRETAVSIINFNQQPKTRNNIIPVLSVILILMMTLLMYDHKIESSIFLPMEVLNDIPSTSELD
jgi:hypothetical protein